MVLTRSQSRLIEESSSADVEHQEGMKELGYRNSCSPYSLDEQYLRESPHYLSKKNFRSSTSSITETHSKYPQRDAAKRALSNLRHTLKVLDEGSSCVSTFNFSHHPSSHNNGEQSSSSSSSLSSSSSASSDHSRYGKGKHGYTDLDERERMVHRERKGPERGGKPYESGRNFPHRQRVCSEESVPSISDSSLREESDSSEESLLESDENDSLSEESVGENPKELFQKASLKAKESVARNIDINHYMVDALGTSNERSQKKREIDRRYRHLFIADKKEKKESSLKGVGAEGSGSMGDFTPLSIDPSIRFDSVGGLPQHIVILREIVLFPLLYPELLSQFHLRPPRGVLFVGPPGTGKTLMARALANEGNTAHGSPITFFMRKGADILSKWVGESERQLSLLFEEAKARRPSIIFFDEIDGLAPVRHSKTEQSHAALVSTFLALMDGLEDRGQVVVIGATNRPDTIDPALRRPGRFDRDLIFPYPNRAARKHVLSIVSRGMLPPHCSSTTYERVEDKEDSSQVQSTQLLDELADMTEGFSGADIQALCVEAGLNRLRTSLPQLYTTSEKLELPLIDDFRVTKEDFFVAARRVQSSIQRTSVNRPSPLLDEHWTYLLEDVRENVLLELSQSWPSLSNVLREESIDCGDIGAAVRQLCSFPVPVERNLFILLLEAPPLPPFGGASKAATVEICTFLAFSLMKRLPSYRSLMVHMSHIQIDFSSKIVEESCSVPDDFIQGHIFELVSFLRRSAPCILLLQGVEEWWEAQGWNSASVEKNSENENNFLPMHQAWIYYMKLLSHSEVLIIIPYSKKFNALESFFGLRSLVSKGQSNSGVDQGFSIRWTAVKMPLKPSHEKLTKFVHYMVRIFFASLFYEKQHNMIGVKRSEGRPHEQWAIHESNIMLENSVAEDKALKLWRKVEFRRLQLRHVLSKWINQYVTSGKYKCLLSPDLDLSPQDKILKDWRNYTSGTRIGLHDILDKVEHHKYVCLSQYHDDIDMLVRNVRSFFRSRSPLDTKYRLKALDLKENTVLGLYKVNRHLVHFCEEHKDVVEPQSGGALLKQETEPSKAQMLLPLLRASRPFYPQKKRSISWGKRRKRKKARLERTASNTEQIFVKYESENTELSGIESDRPAKNEDSAPAQGSKLIGEASRVSYFEFNDPNVVEVTELLRPYTFLELDKVFFRMMRLLHDKVAGSAQDALKDSHTRYSTREEIFNFFRFCITMSLSFPEVSQQ